MKRSIITLSMTWILAGALFLCKGGPAAPAVISSSGRESDERYLVLADSAYSALTLERWPRAEQLLKEALRLQPANPGNTLLFSNLGVAQMQQGKYAEAITSFDIALTRAPRSSTILTHRCRCWLAIDSINLARADLDAVLDIRPRDEWALQTRAMIRLQNSEENEAETDFRTLLDCSPENPWGYFGAAVAEEGRGSPEEACILYRKALDKASSGKDDAAEEQAGFRLSMLLCRERRLDEAAALLRDLLRTHPRSGQLYAAVGWLHRLRYQNDEAEADLKLARQYGADPRLTEWISMGKF